MSHHFDVDGVIVGRQQSHGLLDVPAPQRHAVDCQNTVSNTQCTRPTHRDVANCYTSSMVCLSVCLSHGLLDVPAPQRHTVDCQYAVSHSECAHPTSQSTRPIATDAAWSVCLSLYVLSGPSTPGNKITSGSTNGEMAWSKLRVINDHVAE